MKRRLAMVPALAALLMLVVVVPAQALDEPDRLFLVGERALADRFYPVARNTLERFVTRYPRDPRVPRALVMLGRARLAGDDAQSALEAFSRAQGGLTTPAEQLEAKFWRAEALFRLKRFAEARGAYDDVIRTDAASHFAPDALYGFAWSEMELKQPEFAITALRDLLATWPEHVLAPAATLQLARALVEVKRAAEALPLLTGFPGKYPTSKLAPDAKFLLGWVKVNDGDPRGGLADLKAFVAAYPAHEQVPAAQRLIGQMAGTHGSREDKQAAYKTFMEEKPPVAENLDQAMRIAGELGRPRESEAAWQKLRAHFPEHPLTRRRAWELASAAFKQKNWNDAVTLGQLAAQSEDDAVRAEAWLMVGEAELQLKRYVPASKAFEAVGGVSDVEPGVRFRALAGLGLAREQQKEWKAALSAYESVAKGSPDESLRDWAKARVTAVKAQLARPDGKSGNGNGSSGPKRVEPTKPGGRSTGKKS